MCILGFKTDVEVLNEFAGHKVELSSIKPDFTFMFQSYDWKYGNNQESLILYDLEENESGIKIPLAEIQKITQIDADDIYRDVVEIHTDTYKLSICCMDERPRLPRCYKCGEEIHSDDTKWCVNSIVNYGSHYDSEGNITSDFVNGLNFCDNCIHDFIGDIEVQEVGGYYE